MKLVVFSKVVSIDRYEVDSYQGGLGEDAKFAKVDRGYFMLLEGSHEAIHIGFDPPPFRVGDTIKITFERAGDRNG